MTFEALPQEIHHEIFAINKNLMPTIAQINKNGKAFVDGELVKKINNRRKTFMRLFELEKKYTDPKTNNPSNKNIADLIFNDIAPYILMSAKHKILPLVWKKIEETDDEETQSHKENFNKILGENIIKLIKHWGFANKQLKNRYILYPALKSFILKNSKLDHISLENAKLTNANLENSTLNKVSVRIANLIEANLENSRLSHCNLVGTNLTGANLKKSCLNSCDLKDADLTGADLKDITLQAECDLRGVNFTDADLTNADLRGNLKKRYSFIFFKLMPTVSIAQLLRAKSIVNIKINDSFFSGSELKKLKIKMVEDYKKLFEDIKDFTQLVKLLDTLKNDQYHTLKFIRHSFFTDYGNTSAYEAVMHLGREKLMEISKQENFKLPNDKQIQDKLKSVFTANVYSHFNKFSFFEKKKDNASEALKAIFNPSSNSNIQYTTSANEINPYRKN